MVYPLPTFLISFIYLPNHWFSVHLGGVWVGADCLGARGWSMHPPAHIVDSRSKEQRQSPINGTARVKPSSCPWEGPSEGPHRLCPPQSYMSRVATQDISSSELQIFQAHYLLQPLIIATSFSGVSQSQLCCLLLTFCSQTPQMLRHRTYVETAQHACMCNL